MLAAQSYGPFGEPRDPLSHPQVAAGTPPWGRISLAADGVGRAPKGFTGEWQDPAGMVYLHARWYNPTLGRFTQVDPVTGPLAAPATWQPYAYALNNPLRYNDASGRNVPWLIIGAAAVGAAIDHGAQVYRNRQGGSDWGTALTHVNVGEVLSAGAAAGLATMLVPEAISLIAMGVSGLGYTLGGLGAGVGVSALVWAASYPMSWGASLSGVAGAAEALIYGLDSCPAPQGQDSVYRRPNARHNAAKVGPQTRAKDINTVYEPWVDINADVAEINATEAQRIGGVFHTSSGRTYVGEPNGTPVPTGGPGTHTLDRGAFKALAQYNEVGFTSGTKLFLDRSAITEAQRAEAHKVWSLLQGWPE